MDNVHRATLFSALEILEVLIKTVSKLEDALLPGVEQLRQPVIIHLEILWSNISAELAPDALRFFVSDF